MKEKVPQGQVTFSKIRNKSKLTLELEKTSII